MIKNYLKIAIRNLIKNKSYVIINTFGLGIALACCLTAYILVAYNIEFDSFHADEKVERVFVTHTEILHNDGRPQLNSNAPIGVASAAARDIAGIESFTRFIYEGGYVRFGDNAFREGIAFADSTFFDMFNFPLAKGSHSAFKDRHTIFIGEELAIKYFGKEDPIGKTLALNFPNQKEINVVVGGVLAKVPLNNTFVFDAIMRFEHFMDIHSLGSDSWGDWRDPSTFFTLTNPNNAQSVSEQMAKYIPLRNEAKKDVSLQRFELVPFKNTYDEEEIEWSQLNHRISMVPLMIFTTLGLMILLIACFNLTNTTIAMTAKRLKEVGVRKALGAFRSQIITQFMFEMIITIVLALIAGLLMSRILVPAFVDMWKLKYDMSDLNGVNFFITLVVLVFAVALLAGIYPSLFSSKFSPVALLKGTVRIKGTNMLTRTLVTLQFAISVMVLIAGVAFTQNTKHQEKIDFGYDKEMVVNVRIQNLSEFEIMRNKIRSNPAIEMVAVSDHQVGNNNYQFPVKIDTTQYDARLLGIGENFMEVMGFNLIEGRFMDLENSASDAEGAIVVNKAFVVKTGLTDPIGTQVEVHDIKRRIVGVIDDHIDNLYRDVEGTEPFLFYPAKQNEYKVMLVRASAGELAEVNKYLEKTWKELFPTKPFESEYQEDIILQESKEINTNLQEIFLFMTILGGILSASGIYSLASLNIEKRNKEIGIRKALGASVKSIVTLLNREFVIVLILSGIVGSIGGYYLTTFLLDEIYSYFLEVSIVSVVLSALAIIVIGLATTSGTIFKAAKANPVDTLRVE